MTEMTWEQLDALEAERRAKAREVTDRLAKILAREFSFQELRFIKGYSGGCDRDRGVRTRKDQGEEVRRAGRCRVARRLARLPSRFRIVAPPSLLLRR